MSLRLTWVLILCALLFLAGKFQDRWVPAARSAAAAYARRAEERAETCPRGFTCVPREAFGPTASPPDPSSSEAPETSRER